MSDAGPHRLIGLLAVLVAASVTGATVGAILAPGPSLGRALVALAIALLAGVGAIGVVRGEFVLGVAAGLGFVLLAEGLADIVGVLTLGALGLWLAAGLGFAQRLLEQRRD
ncbi:MAG: hypothetical protein ACLFMX_00995 [Halobacteriales archaeon]